jgi:hypothetical protein
MSERIQIQRKRKERIQQPIEDLPTVKDIGELSLATELVLEHIDETLEGTDEDL